MNQSTIRDRIKAVQREIASPQELTPGHASELLMQATALMGNVLEEILVTDAAYAEVLLELLNSNEAANRAKIRAETTPQYARRQEARNYKTLLEETVRSLKVFIKAQQAEMELAR